MNNDHIEEPSEENFRDGFRSHKIRAFEVRRPKTRAEAARGIDLARGILANIDAAEPRGENGRQRLEIARISWQQKLDELLYAAECLTSDESSGDKRGQEKQYKDLCALTLYVLRQSQFGRESEPSNLAIALRYQCERSLPNGYFDAWVEKRLADHERFASKIAAEIRERDNAALAHDTTHTPTE